MKKLFALLIIIPTFIFAGDLPDPVLTPGAINPAVTQANISTTICKPGWTSTIRPSSYYTTKLKRQQMAALNLPGTTQDYEEDHLISLELGGHPTDPKNLWPERWVSETKWGARKKDVIETYLKRQVCKGVVPLAEAQQAIATDWEAAYKKYIPLNKQK